MIPRGTLTDAGPLVALVNSSEEQHVRCGDILARRKAFLPLVTTWPCLAEAMHLAGRRGKWRMQQKIAALLREGMLRIGAQAHKDYQRMTDLMEQYKDAPMDHKDAPMDLGDASLVVLAERDGFQTIFTLDKKHFPTYKLAGGRYLLLVA